MQILEKAKLSRSKKVNKVETTKELKNPMEVYAQLEAIAKGGMKISPKRILPTF